MIVFAFSPIEDDILLKAHEDPIIMCPTVLPAMRWLNDNNIKITPKDIDINVYGNERFVRLFFVKSRSSKFNPIDIDNAIFYRYYLIFKDDALGLKFKFDMAEYYSKNLSKIAVYPK